MIVAVNQFLKGGDGRPATNRWKFEGIPKTDTVSRGWMKSLN